MLNNENVIVSVASIPQREAGLLTVVDKLIDQCDHINVLLNDYAYIPKSIYNNPKITVENFVGTDVLGDHGKFFWGNSVKGYHFTADDDIIYPDDYVASTVKKIEQYGRKAIVGYHGSLLALDENGRIMNDCDCVIRFRFIDALGLDTGVYMLGTGVMAYHTDCMTFDSTMMIDGGADEQVAMHAQKYQIPMVCLAHGKNWLQDNVKISNIASMQRRKDLRRLRIDRMKTWEQWQLFRTSVGHGSDNTAC